MNRASSVLPIPTHVRNCQAQPQLNSTSNQTKAEVNYILKQIQPPTQPPTHPTRLVEQVELSVNFNSNKC